MNQAARKRYWITYLVIAVMLTASAAMLSGMAEGSFAAFAIFGSPFTVVPFLLIPPFVTWLVLPVLLFGACPQRARWLLLAHFVAAPVAVFIHMRRLGDWNEELRLLELRCNAADSVIVKTMFTDRSWGILLVLPYVAAHLVTWRAFRRIKQPTGTTSG